MEIVDLLSYMYSEGFYCWGLVLAKHVTDFLSEEMVMELVGFDFGFEVVDFVEGFFEEENLDMMDKMVDIDNFVRTFHKGFLCLEPKFEIDFEIGAKVATKSSNLVGVGYTFDY